MQIYREIAKLVDFATKKLLLQQRDAAYVTNNIIDILGLSAYDQTEATCQTNDINELLDEFCRAAIEEGVFSTEDTAYYCDKVMGALSARPSVVDEKFAEIAQADTHAAMQWLYNYCVDNTYVKKAVLDKNPRFDSDGLVVTINLAKPEFRDPNKAKSGNSVKGGYPKCVICRENEGLVSRNKCSLRTVSVTLDGKPWFWQYSPYGYFYQHGICVNTKHTPMIVDRQTFVNLMDFVDRFPFYFIGCNANLERIGGSVLAHDHYQGGGEILPLHKAKIYKYFSLGGYEDLSVGILDWPGTVVRIVGKNKQKIVEVADKINVYWQNYTNEQLGIVCRTEKGQHNAVSPTVVKKDDVYEMNIILRSNITSDKYPDGVFHAHPEFHVIKKESIGLIEAQGLFILPGRLVNQLAELERCVANGKLVDEMSEFAMIFDETKKLAASNNADDVHKAMQAELGSVCYRILQNTAVFKNGETIAFLEEMGFEQK